MILLSLKSIEILLLPLVKEFVPVHCRAEMKVYVVYILKWKEKLLAYAVILYTCNYFGTLKKKSKCIIRKSIVFQFGGIIYCKKLNDY